MSNNLSEQLGKVLEDYLRDAQPLENPYQEYRNEKTRLEDIRMKERDATPEAKRGTAHFVETEKQFTNRDKATQERIVHGLKIIQSNTVDSACAIVAWATDAELNEIKPKEVILPLDQEVSGEGSRTHESQGEKESQEDPAVAASA